MSTTSIIIIVVVAIVAVAVLWVISVQNKLVKSDEFCNNALKQINVQQISRFDALKALVKLTREYATHESETLQKVVEGRKITSSPSPTAADINANEAALQAMSAKLIAVAEAYPDLKANATYQQTMKDIKGYEENVRLSRMTFNDTVTRFNQQVRSFPTSAIAGMLGFSRREYLAEEVNKKDYPDIF
ncbi:MAG: LemA family protein [Bacteroidales bacterium]|nr:LemA family protein [Bacteroidales bacterium]